MKDTVMIHVRVDADFKQAIEEYCKSQGRTVSDWCRWVLENELKKIKAAE